MARAGRAGRGGRANDDVVRSESDVAVVSPRGGKISRLGIGEAVVLGMAGRYLLYQTSDYGINAVLFDSARDTIVGGPVRIGDGHGGARLSRSGTLFTFASSVDNAQDLIAINLDGSRRVVLPDVRTYEVRYSPDGRRIAMRIMSDGTSSIWIYDVVSHTSDRLTSSDGAVRAEWSPDGKRILYSVSSNGIEELWWRPSDGTGKAELLQKDNMDLRTAIMSQDSQWLIYRGGGDIWYRRMQGDTTPRRMSPDAAFRESSPHFSRDGKWLTYTSNETGGFRVYARRFPGPSPRYAVSLSVNAALEPMWSRDGKTIYYREEESLIAASVVLEPEFAVTARKTIATGIFGGMNQSRNYDLAPDGSHILLTQPSSDAGVSLLVVQNWAAEVLAKLAGAKGK